MILFFLELKKRLSFQRAKAQSLFSQKKPFCPSYTEAPQRGQVPTASRSFLPAANSLVNCSSGAAIYTHYGQSAYALPFLELPEVNNISGLAGYGDQVFYRTTDRKSPHNAYTSFEGIQKGIEINGYSQEYAEDFQPGYAFCGVDDEVELPGETEANVVKPGYFLNEPWFEYNPEDKLYYRFQYGDKQIDQLTGEQIAYKNIILQYSSWRKYDEHGYLNIDVDEPNVGKYIVNGKAIDITWKKHTPWGATFYYDTNGNQITMDTGKTWVCIIQDTYADRVEILGSDDSSASSTDTQDSEAQAAAEEAAASDTEY